MKKLMLYIVILCSFASGYGMTKEVGENGKVRLTYDDYGIADDSISQTWSVSEIIDQIKKHDTKSVIELSLQHNYISLAGASLLLNFIATSLENLRVLNLAHNRPFNQHTDKDVREKFINSLIKVLKMPSLEIVDLTGCFKLGSVNQFLSEPY
jgi:Ran GTPase-activating protein (RanGAP) involved in mRNA processing and transport